MSRLASLETAAWPIEQLGEAIRQTARRSGLLARTDSYPERISPPPQEFAADSRAMAIWIDQAAKRIGVESEAVSIPHSGVEDFLRRSGPAIIRLAVPSDDRFLALIRGNRRTAFLLAPDGKIHSIDIRLLRDSVCQAVESPVLSEIASLLNETGIPSRRRRIVTKAIIEDRLRFAQFGDCWILRLPPGASFWRHIRRIKVPNRLSVLIAALLVQQVLLLGSWWLVARGALSGYLDRSWLVGWALLLITLLPFRLLATWLQGMISISLGGLMKQRLLHGALQLDPGDLRYKGSGQQLANVIESAAVEALALSGGFMGLLAVIELFSAGMVLTAGAGIFHLFLLGGWIAVAGLIGWRYWSQRDAWTRARMSMTNDLVENMVGYRTRLAQQPREDWHKSEDRALAQYLDFSGTMDRSTIWLTGLIPRGWLLLGLAGLTASFTSQSVAIESTAVTLGGILLGYQALGRFAGSLSQIAGAAIVWKQIAPLLKAAATPPRLGSQVAAGRKTARKPRHLDPVKIVDAQDVSFRYREGDDAVLTRCSLEIYEGERVLIEGVSGGGKSTLAALVAGLRVPSSGLILINGLDYQTLGDDGWRRSVAMSPQFNENHVLTGSLAFNLLMGRRWPPEQEDLEEAALVCSELGLGSVLARMPSGLRQMVGETGWQLSHGERSRIYLARALLQGADVVILDESFASLDPESLHKSLECALRRARTLVVIAHP